jgi:putative restriction endonuclease
MGLSKFVTAFSHLRTYKDRRKWSPLTAYQAPHKPFLLLSVMDLVAQGLVASNFIEPSLELVDTFNGYWESIMPLGSKGNMAYPFPRLKTDGFWQLIPNPGYEHQINIDFSSMSKLRQICAGAKIDEELFQYMLNPETRERLRKTIIDTHFAPETRLKLLEQGFVNLEAYHYRKNLLELRQFTENFNTSVLQPDKRIRDQGFRKAIVSLYEHRCALCGIRMLTPEGHTVVEAAHIIPWSESQDDRPTNGLCLCRLCHWSFDEGLLSVGDQYEVLISKRVRLDQNNPGHILTLADRPILKPAETKLWPAQDNLEKHRHTTFCRS